MVAMIYPAEIDNTARIGKSGLAWCLKVCISSDGDPDMFYPS